MILYIIIKKLCSVDGFNGNKFAQITRSNIVENLTFKDFKYLLNKITVFISALPQHLK